ncbi:F-BAR domain only protein 2-like isoform X5 [Salvelinus namaycush]|uniref:F-BAR domain only protein 2-like isoform X5 n=1 Tax=Salvelinus namaycush TaxID=8040 RepID=A0A8U0TTL3_SALNM|nr:F-BAR domain only protein 2-like isoform X5 [Salvelinus namaycush]
MITPYFLQNFWGEKNNGFDVLYHNMKHGQISSKELTEFIRERATIEEVYARSMTKLAKSAGNFSQLGTFAPVWDVFKTSTEKLASCHLELVRKLQELIKDVQKYVDDQAKAHKKTKEEVASTLESVQTIQTTGVALQKSKENYNSKTVEQERLRKEGATQRDVDKAGVKAKKATETYKGFVEKYATAKSEFEQKMAETAQKFQDIEESHIVHMKDIIQSYTQSVDETHVQIGEVRIEFERNMENTSVEGLIQKLADSKGTGKERPDPIDFEECNTAIATEGAKPRKRKTFAIPGRRKDNKDTDSTESTEVEPANNTNGVPPGYYGTIDFQNANVPTVDEDGFCIRPEDRNQNDAKENSFYSSSDSEDEDEPRKFRVEIKPVAPNNRTQQSRATIDQLKASIGNISLSPPTSGQMRRNQSRLSGMHPHSAIGSQVLGDELGKARMSTYFNDSRPALNNDLLSLDPFGPAPTLRGSSSSVSSSTVPALARPTTPQTGGMVAPPRPSSRPKLPTGKLTGINEIVRPFSPTKTLSNASPPPAAPLARAESSSSLSSTASLSASNTPTVGVLVESPLPCTISPAQYHQSHLISPAQYHLTCPVPSISPHLTCPVPSHLPSTINLTSSHLPSTISPAQYHQPHLISPAQYHLTCPVPSISPHLTCPVPSHLPSTINLTSSHLPSTISPAQYHQSHLISPAQYHLTCPVPSISPHLIAFCDFLVSFLFFFWAF